MGRETTKTRKATAAIVAAAIAFALGLALGATHPTTALAQDLTAGSATSLGAQDNAQQMQLVTQKAKVHKIRTAAQWHIIGRYKGGTFKIMKNITLPNENYYLNITKNRKYVIDLNGKMVKTAYTGVPLRTVSPLHATKGKVILKSSKKNKGVLYSTETAAVVLQGTAKFYLKSGSIVNNATEFRSDITSGIMAYDKSKCYLQGKSRVRSIGNGVALFGSSKLFTTGKPYVRAGANEYTGQFMHYGSGISVASKSARIKLKGGSFGTKASPDATLWSPAVTMTYAQSANYPILDQFGYALPSGLAKGYKCIDAKGSKVAMRGSNLSEYYDGVNAPSWTDLLASMGYREEQRYTTSVKSADGYYTVYAGKK